MKILIAAIALLYAVSSNAYSQGDPPYGMSHLQAYSIFYENYRTGNYDMALQFGRWMLEAKPRSIEGAGQFTLHRQYERLINVYTELARAESDPSISSAYLDTVNIIYNDAFETFTENEIDYYRWHFNKGRFYQENQSRISGGMDKAYEQYEKAFELDPERLTNAGDGYYINIMLSNYVSRGLRDEALAMIDRVEPYATQSLKNSIEDIRDGLFTDPEERIGFLKERLENNPGDAALIMEIARIYEDTGNRDQAIEYARKLYDVEKTYENARRLANYALRDAQYSTAIRFLGEALELTEQNSQKKEVTILISETHQNAGNLREARRFARQAIQLDRNWGQPHLRMASIYAAAISQCTSGRQMDRDDRSVYWLVLDYLDRARDADPSVANAVQRQYRTYEPVLPTSEDKFFRGWETGDEIRIGSNISECYAWIDETTRVR
jgi:tetratricopeptide (TPR) repeat protein